MPKKSSPKTTVNVDAVKRDAKKIGDQISKANPELFGRELDPGTARRESPLEQEMGSKYKQMIRDHNDKNKHILDRLPFTFPKKRVVRSHRNDVIVKCEECGYPSYGSEYTYIKNCPECKKPTKVINSEAEARGEDRDFTPGFLATASDILKMKDTDFNKKKDQ